LRKDALWLRDFEIKKLARKEKEGGGKKGEAFPTSSNFRSTMKEKKKKQGK